MQQESKKAIHNRGNSNMDEGKNVNNEGTKEELQKTEDGL
jgi:hypothetical protein